MTQATKAQFIAQEIAVALNDKPNVSLYEFYAQSYPEPLLRAILANVLRVPEERIKKSRGALFTYLVKKYANNQQHNHRS